MLFYWLAGEDWQRPQRKLRCPDAPERKWYALRTPSVRNAAPLLILITMFVSQASISVSRAAACCLRYWR